ncbi:hypothetical protein D3C81_1536150 [compost metagenome]
MKLIIKASKLFKMLSTTTPAVGERKICSHQLYMVFKTASGAGFMTLLLMAKNTMDSTEMIQWADSIMGIYGPRQNLPVILAATGDSLLRSIVKKDIESIIANGQIQPRECSLRTCSINAGLEIGRVRILEAAGFTRILPISTLKIKRFKIS